jgi:hypothetical protein
MDANPVAQAFRPADGSGEPSRAALREVLFGKVAMAKRMIVMLTATALSSRAWAS